MKIKNIILILIIVGMPGLAFALDSTSDGLCATKLTNAASYELAMKIGVPVQGVEVIDFVRGPWTAMSGNSHGSATVTIKIGNRVQRNMVIMSYIVSAQQIGSGEDCKITQVEEVQ